MLRFDVYIDGKGSGAVSLEGAHLIGSEGLPLRGEISVEDNGIVCQKRTAGAASLNLIWPVKSAGTLMLETARLPERDEAYILNVELARGRLMRIAQKVEDWGLFDHPGLAEVSKHLNRARDLFIEALKADTAAEAAKLADESLSVGIPASEAMARVHADLFLQKKRNGGSGRRGFGVKLPPSKGLTEAMQAKVREFSDIVSVSMPWRSLQPHEHEGDYSFEVADEQINWLVKNRCPVMAGPLISFAEDQVPDWLILYENDFDSVRDMAVEHIRRVVQRYGRHVHFWRVVSGLHGDNSLGFAFEQVMELTRAAVATVKQLAPKAVAIVEVVEPWGEYYARKSRTVPPLMYAEVLLQSGIYFDAFGLRLPMGMPTRGGYVRDLFQISMMMDRFSALGKPVHVTGFGVPSAPQADPRDISGGQMEPSLAGFWRNGWAEPIQAYWAGHFARIAMSKPFFETLVWEDFFDGLPHMVPNGGMVRPDGTTKAVYEELSAVRKQLVPGAKSTSPAGGKRGR
jgi:GH35 family endo-1,4-beta-xylanase